MIEIDPAAVGAGIHHLMTGIVVPRPIAWVSSLDADGIANLAPHSYFNAVSDTPPIVMFVSTHSSPLRTDKRKDTLRNVEATREFVVHIVSEDLLEAMNKTAASVPAEIDEFELAGLEKAASRQVKPPRVAAARIALECRLVQTLEMGDATVVFGEIVWAHIADEVWRDGRVDSALLRPMARLGGSLYATLGTVLSLKRP
jgi:flavin reductase (DIM6/NTAB) family NADH-FMN oxidoreductase RutF